MAALTVKITDCDHPSVNIERRVLEAVSAQVVLHQCRTGEEVIDQCADADGLINQYAPLTREVLRQLGRCKVIARYGVGINNVDVEAATEFGIQVCNVPDYGVDEVSSHALAMLFTLARKTGLLGNAVRSGTWDFSIARPIRRLAGQTLGIVGLGRIGSALAQKAHAVGLRVIACDRKEEVFGQLPFVERVPFDDLLERSDYISIHCPLTDETRGMFDEAALRAMKPSAYLINTARGGIVDEAALVQALEQGWIAGAGLDVMDREPPEPDHPLFRFDTFLATPHAAWYSEEAFEELKRKAAEEVARVLTGLPPRYPVNQVTVNK